MKYLININLVLLFTALFLQSCVKDGIDDDCPDTTVLHTIRVVLDKESGVSVAEESDISHVHLFVFDNNGEMIELIRNVSLNSWIQVNYPTKENLQFVAFANAGDNVTISTKETSGIDNISESSIFLNYHEDFDEADQIFETPEDIFWGVVTMENDAQVSESAELPINRIVSSVNVKIKGLPMYAMQLLDLPQEPDEEEFDFIIQTRHRAVAFDGNTCGTSVRYSPGRRELLKYDGICEIPTFNMFSTVLGEDVTLYIYYDDVLVDTITEAEFLSTRSSSSGKLLAYNGRLLEIYINYNSDLQVILQNINWWGNVTWWKDF